MLAQTLAASAAGGGGGANLMTFLLPVALILVFWLLLIRPQRKRQREMAQMQQQVQVGQEVMTGAGMMGTIKAVEDDVVVLELSPGVTARFVKQAIMRVVEPDNTAVEGKSGSDESAGSDADSKAGGKSEESASSSADSLPPTHNDNKR